MKNIVLTTLLCSAALLLSSCGEPTYDSSDPEVSSLEMMKNLSENEKKEFKNALKRIALAAAFEGMNAEAISKMLDGKTAKEIIEMGKNTKAPKLTF